MRILIGLLRSSTTEVLEVVGRDGEDVPVALGVWDDGLVPIKVIGQ